MTKKYTLVSSLLLFTLSQILISITLTLFSPSSSLFAADIPTGFDEATIEQVMGGKILKEKIVETKKEFRSIFRAFFPKASVEAYQDLVVDHASYPTLFPEVKQAKTLSTSSDRTQFEYWMKLQFRVGLLPMTVNAYGNHKLIKPRDQVSEGKVIHNITEIKEYPDTFSEAQEMVRVIPYDNGILIHDTISLLLKEESMFSGTIQSQLQAQMESYLKGFRKKLSGKFFLLEFFYF